MTARLFGTDGIRARFGEPPLVEPMVRRLGAALGRKLAARFGGELTVLIGGDTRPSSPQLAQWIAGGLSAAGARPIDLGVVPTAAVAHLVPLWPAAAGVVLSASHNPAEDNGIKLVRADGFKWALEQERAVERLLADEPTLDAATAPPSAGEHRRAATVYRRHLLAAAGGEAPLSGLRLGLDLAHGAACGFEEVFAELGATVTAWHDEPDGARINRDCGATHPEALAARIAGGGFDLGFAFDGDADRAILVDERGAVRDGDAMLYLWARDLASRDELEPPRVVATSMSNLGLERALAASGIAVERCDVGDRAVVETLLAHGLRLGGEQSGHLVDLRRSTTGDGLLTAIVLAGLVARRAGRPVSELLAGFRRYPQLLVNVRVREKPPFDTLPEVTRVAHAIAARLGDDGRLVLRYSGTEPLARIMLEGPDEATIHADADALADELRAAIGAP
jgi:phosphoglucosamine mutase